jgi:hypothetical protein
MTRESLLRQSLPSIIISFGFWRYWFASAVGFGSSYLPFSSLLLLAKVLNMDASIARELGIYLCPVLVDCSKGIPAEVNLSAIDLPSMQ